MKYLRLILYAIFLFILASCSVVAPRYDEVIPLASDQEKTGGTALRTQTLLMNDNGSEVIALQVIKIDDHQVGVKYMYQNDFRKLPHFPSDCVFGKRTFMVPPGEYNLLITYSGEGSYLVSSMNEKQSKLISYKTTIPADSVCAIVSKIDNFIVDVHDPEIKLKCLKKRESSSILSKILF